MKFVITGAAGFIGHALAKKLMMKGHFVVGIDNLNSDYSPKIKESRVAELREYENFQFVRADITQDNVYQLLHIEKTDFFVHLAAKDQYYTDMDRISYTPFLATNVLGTSNMFELAKKLGARKFIFSSTYSVYGKTKKTVCTEKKLLPKPISPHGASKLTAEQLVEFMSEYYKLPAVILRIFTGYGPSMRGKMLIPRVIKAAHANEPLKDVVWSNSGDTRDFIYIDDIVNYIIATFNKRLALQVINIASGTSYSILEVVEKIYKIMGKQLPAEFKNFTGDNKYNQVIVRNATADISRAKKMLRYSPETDIDTGLKNTVDWYLRHPEILDLVYS